MANEHSPARNGAELFIRALENEGAGSWRIAADMAATIDEDKIQTIQEGLRGLQQGLLDMARDLDGCDAH